MTPQRKGLSHQVTGFKYETHAHTAETSRCAETPGAELAEFYAARGYAGVFVTDHFFGSNTTVPEDLPWPERVARFCRGYEAVAERGRALGLQVFFAWEYGLDWSHFLTYGLEPDWLLAHPEVVEWDLVEYFDQVHAAGGFLIHAHPFREAVDLVRLLPSRTDAVEVCNATRPDEANRHARDFALSFGLPPTVGSDLHSTDQERLCGIVTASPLVEAGDYLAALRAGQCRLIDGFTF